MPLPLAHGLVGASIVAAIYPRSGRGRRILPLVVGGVLANCPDLDFLLVFPLHSRTWHRGFSHSFVSALGVGLLFFLLFGKHRAREAVAYGAAFMSHGVLDYLTTKEGGGVELLWPFSRGRLMLGWWGLSEVPSRLPAIEIVKAMVVEFLIFAPPFLAILLLRRLIARPTTTTAARAG